MSDYAKDLKSLLAECEGIDLNYFQEKVRKVDFISALDPRVGLTEDDLLTLTAHGLYYAVTATVAAAKSELAINAQAYRLNTQARVLRAILHTSAPKTVEIGLYQPTAPNADFCYLKGYRQLRLGIQRYDKFVELSTVEEMVVETGGCIDLAHSDKRPLMFNLVSAYSGRAHHGYAESSAVLPAVRFTQPVGSKIKSRPKDAVNRDRRENICAQLRQAGWEIEQHKYVQKGPEDHFEKALYHLKLHKGQLGSAGTARVVQLIANYHAMEAEIGKQINKLRGEVDDLSREISANHIPE